MPQIPFTWVPAGGGRHVSEDRRPSGRTQFPEGQVVSTLCGQALEAREGELAWLWWTCPTCDTRAREIVGAPPRPDMGEQA
ncbi:zinc finger protein [Actinopolyspora mortivallis]|uniref:zinc finger protein n=1 Tax=Actinopolyspora mortivallis TaxID=33906 RepID=UPI000360CA0F|nr:zinc finger protein [Actinopolyspora mortivallis]